MFVNKLYKNIKIKFNISFEKLIINKVEKSFKYFSQILSSFSFLFFIKKLINKTILSVFQIFNSSNNNINNIYKNINI